MHTYIHTFINIYKSTLCTHKPTHITHMYTYVYMHIETFHPFHTTQIHIHICSHTYHSYMDTFICTIIFTSHTH